ncbi:sialate O-acetylesterase [Coraliomargarita sp. SDUM461004]|uniref:Sialate O-acetylesterase n=1 Tax=Thalassobacterium sedimentorum TaxID=3041258 RepID=A0ABU1AM59_9BACT|nr:sialate O-acetylesterase [Coraliomargarita sp. SDUM461004]MDQ8194935.1 sialate O-acetylesterase [Coraliomargarita sp. SDUM461004]
MMEFFRIILFTLIPISCIFSEIRLAPLFQDHGVLQRDMPLRIWGVADPGEPVKVFFLGKKEEAIAASNGEWSVTLAPSSASNQPQSLVVQGANHTITVKDLLVGELWFCSGQSNMAWTVKLSNDSEREVLQANYPSIRLYQVPKASSNKPESNVGGEWRVCMPKTIADFSAVAYYFGRHLHEALDVPIGLINSSWGATQAEAWISAEALRKSSVYPNVKKRWESVLASYPSDFDRYRAKLDAWRQASREAASRGDQIKAKAPRAPLGPGSKREPSGLYNGMVAPFLPATIRGVIWYQGESNAVQHEEYEELFTSLIQDWRSGFEQPSLFFNYVQLANVHRKYDPTKQEFSYIREAQRHVLKLADTGMAVAVDIGERNQIHPGNKQEVGRRLAAIALAQVYDKDVTFYGPSVVAAYSLGRQVRVEFDSGANHLVLNDLEDHGFELAGSDEVFYAAEATLMGSVLLLESDDIASPQYIRYAWGNDPIVSVFNDASYPASPFLLELNSENLDE